MRKGVSFLSSIFLMCITNSSPAFCCRCTPFPCLLGLLRRSCCCSRVVQRGAEITFAISGLVNQLVRLEDVADERPNIS